MYPSSKKTKPEAALVKGILRKELRAALSLRAACLEGGDARGAKESVKVILDSRLLTPARKLFFLAAKNEEGDSGLKVALSKGHLEIAAEFINTIVASDILTLDQKCKLDEGGVIYHGLFEEHFNSGPTAFKKCVTAILQPISSQEYWLHGLLDISRGFFWLKEEAAKAFVTAVLESNDLDDSKYTLLRYIRDNYCYIEGVKEEAIKAFVTVILKATGFETPSVRCGLIAPLEDIDRRWPGLYQAFLDDFNTVRNFVDVMLNKRPIFLSYFNGRWPSVRLLDANNPIKFTGFDGIDKKRHAEVVKSFIKAILDSDSGLDIVDKHRLLTPECFGNLSTETAEVFVDAIVESKKLTVDQKWMFDVEGCIYHRLLEKFDNNDRDAVKTFVTAILESRCLWPSEKHALLAVADETGHTEIINVFVDTIFESKLDAETKLEILEPNDFYIDFLWRKEGGNISRNLRKEVSSYIKSHLQTDELVAKEKALCFLKVLSVVKKQTHANSLKKDDLEKMSKIVKTHIDWSPRLLNITKTHGEGLFSKLLLALENSHEGLAGFCEKKVSKSKVVPVVFG